jgi:hypothetical protein
LLVHSHHTTFSKILILKTQARGYSVLRERELNNSHEDQEITQTERQQY